MADLALYKLTVEVRQRYEESGLSAREVARLLGTSPSQLYRLLDTTNYSKNVKQMLSLIGLLGWEVKVEWAKIDYSDRQRGPRNAGSDGGSVTYENPSNGKHLDANAIADPATVIDLASYLGRYPIKEEEFCAGATA